MLKFEVANVMGLHYVNPVLRKPCAVVGQAERQSYLQRLRAIFKR